ncbi:MAG: hypothetical protein M3R13_03950 [Armatimonadota bacterium]|nr:hypothetical protein [Armatimonadota bacterium]
MTLGRRAFADEERAKSSIQRLTRLGPVDWLEPTVIETPDPDRALHNLERWVGVGEEASKRLESLSHNPALRFRLSFLMGASQPLADSLAKNPELALILGDPDELSRTVTADEVIAQGTTLVSRSISFLHGLDRLRHLKQRTLLRIVWNDLSTVWEPEVVWGALSALADGILEVAAHVVWQDLSPGTELPLAVVALGKHGSSEVNYSSDLDLLFVSADGADQELCDKFCGRFVRALEGKMGRGDLYRVDLRLRPMGKSGPVVLGKSATIRYYGSYCEPWEIQALIRSRICAGNRVVGEEFMSELEPLVYKGPRSDSFLDGVIEAKRRYEGEIRSRGEAATNIKLGPGGIRDIEFVVQLYQLILGDAQPSLQGASVTAAINVLVELGELEPRNVEVLRGSYGLFRQIEHRIQLRQNRQLHTLPSDPREKQVLAKLSGFGSWSGLDAELRRRRSLVREFLEQNVPALAQTERKEHRLAESLRFPPDSAAASAAEKLLAASDSPKALLAEVNEDPATAARVRMIVERAPRIVSDLAFHRGLWDVAFGEQIEFDAADDEDPGDALRNRLAEEADWQGAFETALRREAVIAALKDAHHGDIERTYRYLTAVAEAALSESLARVGGERIDIVVLGRLGSRELLLGSDWDVMLLCENAEGQERAERVGQEWVRTARRIAMASASFPIDVRLRPEGGAGLVVRSLAGFTSYAETAMEAWERLAFTRARSLSGSPASDTALAVAWGGREWTWEDEQEILRMRRRVQNERMRPWEAARDLKLGEGHTLDIEWLIAVLKLRHPEIVSELQPTHAIVNQFAEQGVLSQSDADELAVAALHFARLRNAMYLLDFDSDSVLPENPERLARIAEWMGLERGNDLLAMVGGHRENVNRIFAEVVQSL